MKLIKLEFKRALNDKLFLFLIIFILLFYVYVNYKMGDIHFISDNNFYIRLFFISPDNIELTNIYYFIVPMLASLAGGDLLGKDLRSKEYLNIVSRYNREKLLICKAVVSFTIAGLVIVLPYLIDFIIKFAMYPVNLPSITLSASFQDIIGMSTIFVYKPMLYTLISILTTFLFAGLCSLIGFLVSFYTTKKLLIVTIPFLLSVAQWNIINIFRLKDFSIPSILIFRVTQNVLILNEIIILFLVPFIIVLFMIFIGVKKYDFI